MDLQHIPHALSFSPRAGGNSDQAVSLFRQGLTESGAPSNGVHLRSYNVLPCISCHRCEHSPKHTCCLEPTDDAAHLFKILLEAPALFISSPIYFYHLPAQAKAFIDRSQNYWIRHQTQDPEIMALPKRKAHVALVAARPQGEKLFEGSLLTLKYFLRPFNFEIGETLLYYGIDQPEDLASHAQATKELIGLGRNCANSLL